MTEAERRLREAVRSTVSDPADAAAVLVNVGDLRAVLRSLSRVEALCARWDALSKRETTTTREIRAAITGTAAG